MAELTYEKPKSRRKPKGPTARRIAKRRRAEWPVAKAVRAACVERDGFCRVGSLGSGMDDQFSAGMFVPALADGCDGRSEWAHLGEMKRAKTRGMKPDARHTTAGSLMLCTKHHDRYDGRQRPRMAIHELNPIGANGALHFIDEGDL